MSSRQGGGTPREPDQHQHNPMALHTTLRSAPQLCPCKSSPRWPLPRHTMINTYAPYPHQSSTAAARHTAGTESSTHTHQTQFTGQSGGQRQQPAAAAAADVIQRARLDGHAAADRCVFVRVCGCGVVEGYSWWLRAFEKETACRVEEGYDVVAAWCGGQGDQVGPHSGGAPSVTPPVSQHWASNPTEFCWHVHCLLCCCLYCRSLGRRP